MPAPARRAADTGRFDLTKVSQNIYILRHPIQLTKSQKNSRKIAEKSQKNSRKIVLFFCNYFHTPKKSQKNRRKIATYFHEKLLRRENLRVPRTSGARHSSHSDFRVELIFRENKLRLFCDYFAIILECESTSSCKKIAKKLYYFSTIFLRFFCYFVKTKVSCIGWRSTPPPPPPTSRPAHHTYRPPQLKKEQKQRKQYQS
jgi:hypothetical protein